ncbi:MAG: assimilatory sulfite reductase (NADPH) flavoprotein subunit [Gammaproteobacteria bacterium]|nr:assimilatory sulfite reductase (NADPH) flavoprotein subunit [Gammaproteobacteria bacterium]
MLNTKLSNIASPLKGEQLNSLQSLLKDLSPIQTAWVSGYLASMNQLDMLPDNDTDTLTNPSVNEKVTILYGSQTGNAQAISNRLEEKINSQGLQAQVFSMDEYKVRNLSKETWVLFVVSTQGEGEPPENAYALHSFLNSKRATRLEQLNFAVLGLGDSSYPQYCEAAKDFDKRLGELGATRLFERLDCDVDYQNSVDHWSATAIEKLKVLIPPPNSTNVVSLQRNDKAAAQSVKFDKDTPYRANLLANQKITTTSAETEVRHLVLSIDPDSIRYSAGDALGIWFKNDPVLVDALLESLGFNGNSLVSVGDAQLELRQALIARYELTRLHPTVVKDWAKLVNSEGLNTIVSDNNSLTEFINHRQLFDLATEFPAKITDTESFVNLLQPLAPRLYSIASSPVEYDDEIHLTVSVVRQEFNQRVQLGGASGYLIERIEEDSPLDVYLVKNNSFRLPVEKTRPVIMIGAGTGIAPFRAFIQQRADDGDSGPNWLVYGNRHFHHDFLYQLEIQQHHNSGLLSRVDLAFSRDQESKKYVQHRLLENSSELFRWLEEGAYLYVCGSTRMGAAVHDALTNVVLTEGGYSLEETEEYLNSLRIDGRYQKDVY